jgi:SSS family solute:Na+ symporter
MNLLTILVLAYLAVVLIYGLKGSHYTENSRSFLTCGRSAGAVFCALSLVSTIIGGSATLGMGSLAQKTGAAAFWWLGVGAVGLLFHGFFVAPKIRAMNAVTLPEVVDEVAGPAARKFSGLIIAVSWVAVTAAQFVALHALFLTLAPAPLGEVLFLLIAAGVLLHTAAGGQSGVIRTDAVQAVLLLGGFTAAALWLLGAMPEKAASLDWVPFNASFGAGDWVKMMLLVGITYIIGPDMFSRTFSARDGGTARRAAWAAAPILVWFGVAITFLAMMNLDAAQPVGDWLSDASPMPVWVKAAVAVGLISALSGSADTVLLSASGIVERDLLGGDRTSGVRLLVTLFGCLSVAAVYMSGDIIKLLLSAYSLFVPGVAVPLLIALVGRVRRLDSRLWLIGSAAGGALGLAGNLTGIEACTYLGMAASAAFAIAAKMKPAEAPAAESARP